ncbi:hypothetical protein CEXT_543291 [Caerostris extrusa]|uniref:Uncharacterized protein n=1 Tax=Caerostris extrusa TaxID=172846 RepID=A0AAV4XSY9_CAEEX|nr:hypothetical protein CEXT_543291 [Caerostris extrusa]
MCQIPEAERGWGGEISARPCSPSGRPRGSSATNGPTHQSRSPDNFFFPGTKLPDLQKRLSMTVTLGEQRKTGGG